MADAMGARYLPLPHAGAATACRRSHAGGVARLCVDAGPSVKRALAWDRDRLDWRTVRLQPIRRCRWSALACCNTWAAGP